MIIRKKNLLKMILPCSFNSVFTKASLNTISSTSVLDLAHTSILGFEFVSSFLHKTFEIVSINTVVFPVPVKNLCLHNRLSFVKKNLGIKNKKNLKQKIFNLSM